MRDLSDNVGIDEAGPRIVVGSALHDALENDRARRRVVMTWSTFIHAFVTGFSAGFGFWLFNRLFR